MLKNDSQKTKLLTLGYIETGGDLIWKTPSAEVGSIKGHYGGTFDESGESLITCHKLWGKKTFLKKKSAH